MSHATARRPKRRRSLSSIAAAVSGLTRPIRAPRRSSDAERTCSTSTKLRCSRFASGGSMATCCGVDAPERVSGQITTRSIRLRFRRSTDTTTAGLLPPCSCPRTGSRSAHQTSPRLGFGPLLLRSPLIRPVIGRQTGTWHRIQLLELLPVLAPLSRRPRFELSVDRVPESLVLVARDGVLRDLTHGLLRLFRDRLERRVTLPRKADEGTRHRAHG